MENLKVPTEIVEKKTKFHEPTTPADFCQIIDNFLINESNVLGFEIDNLNFEILRIKKSGHVIILKYSDKREKINTSDDVIKFVEKCIS